MTAIHGYGHTHVTQDCSRSHDKNFSGAKNLQNVRISAKASVIEWMGACGFRGDSFRTLTVLVLLTNISIA